MLNRIVELWNLKYQEQFDKYAATVKNPDKFHIEWEKAGVKLLDGEINAWLKEDNEALGGLAPEAIIIDEVGKAPIQAYKTLYFGVEQDLPKSVIDYFAEFEELFLQLFLENITEISKKDVDIESLDLAVNFLTEIGCFRMIPELCKGIELCRDEVLVNWLCEALISFKDKAKKPLKEYILNNRKVSSGRDSLLSILAFLFKGDSDDEVFQVEKAYFKSAANKVIPTVCLRDLGNGKAVPMLKAYLDKTENISKPEKREIVGTLKELGADISEYLE